MPGGAAQEDEGRALVDLAGVVVRRADDHVGVAVAVHVAGARRRSTPRSAPAWFDSSCGVGGVGIAVGDAAGAAQEDEGRALVGLAGVVR